MRVYKFNGNYEKLKDYGYTKFNMILLAKGVQLWGKITELGSIVISDYVSIKLVNNKNEPASTSPQVVKPFIEDLIKDNLVSIQEKE